MPATFRSFPGKHEPCSVCPVPLLRSRLVNQHSFCFQKQHACHKSNRSAWHVLEVTDFCYTCAQSSCVVCVQEPVTVHVGNAGCLWHFQKVCSQLVELPVAYRHQKTTCKFSGSSWTNLHRPHFSLGEKKDVFREARNTVLCNSITIPHFA